MIHLKKIVPPRTAPSIFYFHFEKWTHFRICDTQTDTPDIDLWKFHLIIIISYNFECFHLHSREPTSQSVAVSPCATELRCPHVRSVQTQRNCATVCRESACSDEWKYIFFYEFGRALNLWQSSCACENAVAMVSCTGTVSVVIAGRNSCLVRPADR